MTHPLGLVRIVLSITPVVVFVANLLGFGLSVLGLHEHPLCLLLLVELASGLTTAVALRGLLDRFDFCLECGTFEY